MKKMILFFFMFILLCPPIAFGLPIDVAGQTLDQEDLIYLLSRQMGVEKDVAALAWTEMDQAERGKFLSHVIDVVVLAEAGNLRGLSFNDDVQRQLRWDRINTMAKAYVDRIKMDWILNDKEIKSFYEKNIQRYVAPVKVLARIDNPPMEGTPRWYRMEELPSDVKNALKNRLILGKLPPFVGGDGQVWSVEILEFGVSAPLPLIQVREQVIKDIKSTLLDEELSRLKNRFSVKMGVDTK